MAFGLTYHLLRTALGINLETMFDHHDLMHDCWQCNLKGGYQAVQRQLDISRIFSAAQEGMK